MAAAPAVLKMKMPQQATYEPMRWTHSQAVGLSNVRCEKCEGTGLRPGPHRTGNWPCNCVLRNIFRACLARFQHCDALDAYISAVRYEHRPGAEASATWSRVAEDYKADFYLIAKRTLTEDEFRLFKLHFLWGGDSKLCCRRLSMDRGAFFHAVYRIEQKLGRVYREVRPYSLFPLDEYFMGAIRKAKVLPVALPHAADSLPLRPPMAA